MADAEILKNKIKEVLQKGEKVVVSFSGIEMIYPIFLLSKWKKFIKEQ